VHQVVIRQYRREHLSEQKSSQESVPIQSRRGRFSSSFAYRSIRRRVASTTRVYRCEREEREDERSNDPSTQLPTHE